MIDKLKRTIGINPLRWLANTRRMVALVEGFSSEASQSPAPAALHCGVVITPWLGTSIPWFSLAVGLLLARKGHRVSFLLDDQPFGGNEWRYQLVLRCLRTVMEPVRRQHRVVDLSALRELPPLSEAAAAEARRLATLNAVWEMRGEMAGGRRRAFEQLCERQLKAAYPAIASLVHPGAYDLLFMPGGVWGTSGIWSLLARAAGIRIASYDTGGYGTVMLAASGVACQLQDIPAAFARVKAEEHAELGIEFALREARTEMDKRRAGVDTFLSQVQGSNGGDSRYDGAVLLALNSSWDSAALGLHTVFKDNSDWIVQTVRFLLERTEAPVIVRQHPAERLEIARTSDDYRALLQANFGSHPRLHFIAAADRINSYALMARVSALVVYTSTIGIEAAAHGRPVITPSNSYYSRLGFVQRVQSLAEYQAALVQAARGELRLTEAQQRDAHLCYYLTQCCNWVFSPFNPADFDQWSRKTLAHWYADANVQRMLQSLVDNMPVAYLNHAERMAQASRQAQEAAA